ncbi:MAG: UDP-N-acetylmuramate dehydrogenase [Planctomycetes bacterium]|nr:UDP-N-acetylmuramate dehydrogenase [Planctomycetota bacterium]MCW8135508.1 UDP-N-acetylmuramate dehydrogenase [Planctomycetota bacterium]
MSILAFPRRLRDRVQPGFPMAKLTTLRIGGPAQYFVSANTLRDVADTCAAARECGLPMHVIGGGSNLLVHDRGVAGIVLSLHGLKKIQPFGAKVHVQAGANLSALIAACNGAGIGGPQNLAGIPGTVGGALAMNAGGRYGEIADYVASVVWINEAGELQSLYREEIDFGYRHSSLRGGVVIEAVLEGKPGEKYELVATARRIMQEKLAAQPYSEFSAGCTFKNPKGQSAGMLVDKAGCKGLSVGGAKVSERHGNFIVNRGDASATDMLELMTQVQRRVLETFGVELQPEVQIWPGRVLPAA